MLNVGTGELLRRRPSPAGRRYCGAMEPQAAADQLRELRRHADEDFGDSAHAGEPGRHQTDITELGLRVSITRSRYPNRDDGVDMYAVTISRSRLDRPPDQNETGMVLVTAFGESAADRAVRRDTGGALVRLFRVPA